MSLLITSKKQTLTERLGSDTAMPINGSFKTISGVDVLLQDIQQLLLTLPGERPFRPTFGCLLRTTVWENLDAGAEQGAAHIKNAILNFEPRITVLNINVSLNRNTGLVSYTIQFLIKDTDQQVNLIFPFRAGTDLSFN